jgi:hypothetical protein
MSCHYLVERKDLPSIEPSDPRGCGPLSTSLGDEQGEPRPGHFGTPERFITWVTGIWQHKVRRSNFRRADFTRNCVLIDPFATVHGARRCSRYFRTVFLAFPDLSGPHFTWAANHNTIVVNWGFLTTRGREKILVPSIDIFGFKNGRVSYRVASFDRAALVDALVRAYPDRLKPSVAENLLARMWLWHVHDQFANAEIRMLRETGKLSEKLPRW